MKERNKDFLVGLLRTMVRIRLFEEGLVAPILSGEIRCPVHLYSGEEAIAAGICAPLSGSDRVFGSHRSHGHYLAKGGDMARMAAEIFCRRTGCAGGRGGSMHVIAPQVGMMGAAPIVAGTIALAVGAAYASAVKGDGTVSVAFFGDGAAGEGVLYESLNLASVRRLPVLFVCENNLYSTHLPIRECRVKETIHEIAEPFGIWNARVDGNDVLRVLDAAEEATARCRGGSGPTFVECLTYRLRGHVGPDDNIQGSHTDIRPAAELAEWQARDPIPQFRSWLNEHGMLSPESWEHLEREVHAEVRAALDEAARAEFPDKKELSRYVFA